MKVIFLDIDGVMKSVSPRSKMGRQQFSPTAVMALNSLTQQTGAKLVISSTWRELGWDLPAIFHQNGVKAEIIGFTPVMHEYIRGVEIEAWLDTTAKPVTGYVILDDDDDMGAVKTHLVQTDSVFCLGMDDVKRALTVLDQRLRG